MLKLYKTIQDMVGFTIAAMVLGLAGSFLGISIVKILGLNVVYPAVNQISGLSTLSFTVLLYTLFLGSIVEETIFRYIFLREILLKLCKTPPSFALVISSVAFGLIHLLNDGNWVYNLPQVVSTIGCGLVFGHAYRKNNLLFVIVLHTLYNLAMIGLSMI